MLVVYEMPHHTHFILQDCHNLNLTSSSSKLMKSLGIRTQTAFKQSLLLISSLSIFSVEYLLSQHITTVNSFQ